MFSLHLIQAEEGDCLLLQFGTVHAPRFVLIDGGPPAIYQDHLRRVLQQKVAGNSSLERVMLSHVDNDHISGLLDLFAELRSQHDNGQPGWVAVGGLWHNSFSRTLDPAGALQPRLKGLLALAGVRSIMTQTAISVNGIDEGNQLRLFAQLLNVPLNADTPDPITVDSAAAAVTFGNLKLTVVGPTQANLDALRGEWEQWLADHEDAIGSGNPRVMANSDKSIPNLSSICLLAEADGQSLLLTGDARSDFVLDGLRAKGLLDAAGGAHFNVLKVPHHGSDRNMTKSFFKKVTADGYAISANGKDDNPDLATLIWLVEAAKEQNRRPEIFLTNSTPSTRKLVQEYLPDDYGYTLQFLPDGADELEIKLA